MDDVALVEAVRADPQQGFATLYRRYGDRIHDYCLAVLRHREDAADAAQDTFLIAYERLGQLRDPARLTAWLYAIARSRCLRRVAERKRTYPTDDIEPPAAAAASSEVERADLQRLVWEAAAGLAADDRAVLDLHLRQGLSGAELAGALGVPAPKANLMLHRMKQRLRRTVGALLVARTGRRDCADLAAITGGDLTPLLRKRVARHVERCLTCRGRRDQLAPELLYATVPVAAAPVAIGARLARLTDPAAASGSTTSAGGSTTSAAGRTTSPAGRMQWRSDGFPRQPAGHPLAQVRAPVATGVTAIGLALAVLSGAALVGGGAPATGAPEAAALPSPAASATAPPTGTPPPPPLPPASPAPPPASPTGAPPTVPSPEPTVVAEAPAPAPGENPGEVPAAEPPALSPLRLGNCGVTLTAEVDITGTGDPAPTSGLMLSGDAGPGWPVPMQPAGGNTYRAVVERKGAALGYVTFTVSGTVADSAGNSAYRTASAACTPIVD